MQAPWGAASKVVAQGSSPRRRDIATAACVVAALAIACAPLALALSQSGLLFASTTPTRLASAHDPEPEFLIP
jgi:hypothetical protein